RSPPPSRCSTLRRSSRAVSTPPSARRSSSRRPLPRAAHGSRRDGAYVVTSERIDDLLALLADEPDDALLRFTLGKEYRDGDAATCHVSCDATPQPAAASVSSACRRRSLARQPTVGASEKLARDVLRAPPVVIDGGVHPSHRVGVDRVLEARERGDRPRLLAH